MTASGDELNATPRRKANVPLSDADFQSLCNSVSASWLQNPWLSLRWHTAEEFAGNAASYAGSLSARTMQGSRRSEITGKLRDLDRQIDESLEYVKGYLADKYGKKIAKDYYSAFGIVRKGKAFIMPRDRNHRLEALAQMVTGIAQEGFDNKTYGYAFWTDLRRRFEESMNLAVNTDSGVSEKTGNKNRLKGQLRKALNSIILVIKANYPDTWKTELRNWGFQKEKY